MSNQDIDQQIEQCLVKIKKLKRLRELHCVIKGFDSADDSIKKVAGLAGKIFGFSVDEMISSRRPQDLCDARFAAFYVLRTHTSHSLESIGDFFNKDHTGVSHGVAQAKSLMETNRAFREKTLLLEKAFLK